MPDPRWCHTLNPHKDHNYGPGLWCPGTRAVAAQLLAKRAEELARLAREQAPVVTVDNLREYWTVGDGAKPLDPIQRLLDAQRVLREARTDEERRAALHDCEEAIAAKDAAARASFDAMAQPEPEKRHPAKAYRPRTSLKR